MKMDKFIVAGTFVLVLAVVLTVPMLRDLSADQPASAASAASASSGAPQGQARGIWLQLHNSDPNCPYEQYVREIAATGANTVCLSIAAYQENCSSTSIFVDSRKTVSAERLGQLFALAKSLHLKVIFMPIVLLDNPRSGEWRGKINPSDWNAWWQSYTDYIVEYAALAKWYDVDVFMVGSELVSTETSEQNWRTLIDRVRDRTEDIFNQQFRQHLREQFPAYTADDYRDKLGIDNPAQFVYSELPAGKATPALQKLHEQFRAAHQMKLSYSANWDHYKVVTWWDALDAVGMTSYYNLNPSKQDDPSLASLMEAWKPVKADIEAWQKKIGKPILFTEVGWASQKGCSTEPWNYYHSTEVALQEQQRCMESFLATFANEPYVSGVLIWKWRDHPQSGGDKDYGYTPYGKPVMKDLETFFSQPMPQRPGGEPQRAGTALTPMGEIR